MLSREQVVRELKVYFFHLNNPVCPSGFPMHTVIGKLISGNCGGTKPVSFVPHGIEMADSDYLQCINRVDCALVALKSHDVVHGSMLWEYVQARYRLGLSIAEIMALFKVSKRCCMKRQSQAILFISCKIT